MCINPYLNPNDLKDVEDHSIEEYKEKAIQLLEDANKEFEGEYSESTG